MAHGSTENEAAQLAQALESAKGEQSRKRFVSEHDANIIELRVSNALPAIVLISPKAATTLADGTPLDPLLRSQLCNELQRIVARSEDNTLITPDQLSHELLRTAAPTTPAHPLLPSHKSARHSLFPLCPPEPYHYPTRSKNSNGR